MEKWCPICIDEARKSGLHTTVILADFIDCESPLHENLGAARFFSARRNTRQPKGPDGKFISKRS